MKEKEEKFQELSRKVEENIQEVFRMDKTQFLEKLKTLLHSIKKDMREIFGIEEEILQGLIDTSDIEQKMDEVERHVQCLTEESRTKIVLRRENEVIPLLTSSDEGWIVEKQVLRDDETINALILALMMVLLRRKIERMWIKLGFGA